MYKNDVVKYTKGGIWWMDLGDKPKGITKDKHMVMIISEISNPLSTCTVSVCPISHCESATKHKDMEDFFLVPIHVKSPSYVCCNQIQTVLTSDFMEYAGQASPDKIKEVNEEVIRYLKLNSGIASNGSIKSSDYVIKCVTTDKTYPTIAYAAECCKISHQSVRRSIQEGCEVKGLKFEKVETQKHESL